MRALHVPHAILLGSLAWLGGCYDLDALRPGLADLTASAMDLTGPPVTDASLDLSPGADLRPAGDMSSHASLCGARSFALCDGFETGVISQANWYTVNNGGTTITVDDTFSYRGTYSLRLDAPATVSDVVQAEIVESSTFANADVFARAFVFLPANAPAVPTRYITELQSESPNYGIDYYMSNGTGAFVPQIYDSIDGTTYHSEQTGTPGGAWLCLEWEIVVGNPGRMNVWIDDVPYTDLSLTLNTMSSPPFGSLSFGMLHAGGAVAHTAWIDEIAVDYTRIGCAS